MVHPRSLAGLLALFVAAAHSPGQGGREVQLEKTLVGVPAVTVSPLFIHLESHRQRIQELLDKEARLVQLEGMMAGDLAGFTESSPGAAEESLREAWAESRFTYALLARAAGLAGEAVGWFTDTSWSVARLYEACFQISTLAGKLAKQRHLLEAAYFDLLMSPPEPGKEPAGFFTLDEDTQNRIVKGLRGRLLDMRRMRQETLEHMLLAIRDASRWGIPIAAVERGFVWSTTSTARVEGLRADRKQVEARIRTILASIEQTERLLEYADKKIQELVAEARKAQDAGVKAAREREVARLREQRAALQARLEGGGREKGLKPRLAEARADSARLGEEAEKAAVEAEAEAAGTFRHSVNQMAAAVSHRFTELALRRRIHARATAEARHLAALAERFGSARRNALLAQLRQLDLLRATAPAGVLDGEGPKPEGLALACIDQGLAAIVKAELDAEDAALGQLMWFQALSDWYKQREGKVEGSESELGMDVLKAFTEEAQWYMGLFSGMYAAFMDEVKSITNEQDLIRWGTDLDRIHAKVRRERQAAEKKAAFLVETAGAGGGLRARVAATAREPREWRYEPPRPAAEASALDLFREDKAFFDALDGGLIRIAACEDRSEEDRLVTEFMIAYEKACLTLRDLMRAEFALKGLDQETGEWTFKVLISPVKFIQQVFLFVHEKLLGRPWTVTEYVQIRGRQLEAMRVLFPRIRAIGFDGERLGELPEGEQRRHLALRVQSPDYRRFWNRAAQERVASAAARLAAAHAKSRNWRERMRLEEQMARVKESAPDPRSLALALVEDGKDMVLLQNYPGALQSFIQANELDWRAMSTETLTAVENLLARIQTFEAVGALTQQIGDQIIWYLIFQGLGKNLPGLGPAGGAAAGEGAAAAGAVTAAEVTKTSVRSLLAAAVDKGLAAAHFLYSQVNPLSSVLSVQLLAKEGLRGVLSQAGSLVVNALGQEALRDVVLVRHLNIDPETADWMANLLWEIGQKYYEAGSEKLGAELNLFTVAYRLKRMRARLDELAAGHAEAEKILADPEASWFQRWRAQRLLLSMGEAALLRERLHEVQDELGKLLSREGAGEAEQERVKERLQEAQALGRDFYGAFHPLVEARIAEVMGQNNLAGRLKSGNPQEVAAAAVEAFRQLDYDFLSHHKFPDTPEGRETARLLDGGRRELLFQTFDRVSREGASNPAELLKELGAPLVEEWRKSGVNPDERIKILVAEIQQIVPTGSAASESGGEYVPLKSDMDFTLVLRDAEGKITDMDRAVLQALLEAQFRKTTRLAAGGVEGFPGFDAGLFDISFMVDTEKKFNARLIEAAGPAEFLRKLKDADPDTVKRYIAELEKANSALDLDMRHPERYVTAGRYRGLGFLTALGDFILVWDPAAGRYKKVLKKEALAGGDEGARRRVLEMAENAHLEPWMGMDIMVEDFAFLRVKGAKFATGKVASAADLWAYTKEMDKRAIRVLMGWLASHPEGVQRLNALVRQVMEGGKPANHGTICDIAIQLLSQDSQARAAFERQGIPDICGLIREWRRRKMGGSMDDVLGDRMGQETEAAGPMTPEYRKALQAKIRETEAAMKNMLLEGVYGGQREVRGLIDALKAAREAGSGWPPEAVEAMRRKLQLIMKSYATTYERLGPEEQKMFREQLVKAGCDFDSFVAQIREAREAGSQEYDFGTAWFFSAKKDEMEEFKSRRR